MPNQTVNKVEFGGQTVMDITDTTAEAADIIEGEVFYTKSGARSVGTLTDATQSTHGLMSTSDKIKLDGIDLLGVKLNSTALLPDANGYVNIPVMTGATSSAAGATGLVPAPTSADYEKFLRGDGTWQDGGKPMVILSYGNSTWNDFITAYNNHVIVYCRASSNSNPASGSQTRMAFMAYVNDATSPTNVEFQYYRSMNAHSATAMGDEVYVYKLTSAGAWSVTVRKASIKEIAVASGSKLGVSWSSDKVTLSNTMTADDMPMSSSDATTTKAAIEAKQNSTDSSLTTTAQTIVGAINEHETDISTLNSNLEKVTKATSANGGSITISSRSDLESKIQAIANGLTAGESKLITVYTATFSDDIYKSYTNYSGYIVVNNVSSGAANYFSANLVNNKGEHVVISREAGSIVHSSINSNIPTKARYTNDQTAYSGDVLSATAGIYKVLSNAVTNLPISANGILEVITRGTNIKILTYYTDTGRRFINSDNGGTWTGWEELALNSNTVPHRKTITLNNARDAVSGLLTANSNLRLWIPHQINLSDGTNGSVTSASITYAEAYVNGSDVVLTQSITGLNNGSYSAYGIVLNITGSYGSLGIPLNTPMICPVKGTIVLE